MSANLNGLSAFERLNDDSRFDESGKIKPLEEGESGENALPAKAEETAASQPSPDATPPPPAPDKPAEDQSGKAPVTTAAAEQGKPPATTDQTADDPEETALKTKFSKPEDKGPEWGIRAYRDVQKKYGKVIPAIDAINSPERAARGLEFVGAFTDPDSDIGTAVAKMTALSSSRTEALTNYLYTEILDNYPENLITDLIGEKATVDELKQGLALVRSGVKAGQEKTQPQPAATTEPPKPEGMTDEEWDDFKIDYPGAYKAMQAQYASAQKAEPEKPAPAEDPEKAQLQERLKEYEEGENATKVQAIVQEVDAKGKEIYEKAFSVVKDGLRELGLEPDPAKDDERTIKLKKETAASIESVIESEFEGPDGPDGEMDWSRCSPEQKENRQLVKKVMGLLAARDFNAASDYIPHLQARIDLAFQRVAEAKMDLYNAAMLQPTKPTRNAGEQVHRRPEIVNGTVATGAGSEASKTPWLNPGFRLPGESSFDAMRRYMDEQETLPGR